MKNPYQGNAPKTFWKSCADHANFRLDEVFSPKFSISENDRIATIGSCFAQHITKRLRQSDATFLDVEAAPRLMPPDVQQRYGFGLFSARYGNVYTARQALQLFQDARRGKVDPKAIWERDGRYFDAIRPTVEPRGHASASDVKEHRREHLEMVFSLMGQMDVLIFTLGLTETWADKRTGRVFPTAPGVVAAPASEIVFRNFNYPEVISDIRNTLKVLRRHSRNLKVLFTISPVPLAATATSRHVLVATNRSKSVLRAAVEEIVSNDPLSDYFPSFDIVNNIRDQSSHFHSDLRTVNSLGVDNVMKVFSQSFPSLRLHSGDEDQRAADQDLTSGPHGAAAVSVQCDEELLESFAPK